MKTTISLTEATVYLQREFDKARPRGCKTCSYPKPFWGPAVGPGNGAGYWYLNMPPPCPEKCLAVISRLWGTFTTEYEIEHLPYDTSAHREQRMALAARSTPRPAVFTRHRLARTTSK